MSAIDTHVRETFYAHPNRTFTLAELSQMLDLSIGEVYSVLVNLVNRRIIDASWDTSTFPRRRTFKLKR